MKKYKVFLSNNKVSIDRDMVATNKQMANKQMANECERIENLINLDYETQEPDNVYGELHSISEITNYNTDEKNLLTIFEKEVNNVEFILPQDNKSDTYELTNQELKYINDFKKVIIDEKKFTVEDISYDLSEEIIKVVIKKVD